MFRRRRFRRSIASMDHRTAFSTLRLMSAQGSTDHRTMLMLAERALATSPDGETCFHVERWLVPLREGRVIRTKTGGKLVSIDGTSVDLIEAVDEIYNEVNEDETETH